MSDHFRLISHSFGSLFVRPPPISLPPVQYPSRVLVVRCPRDGAAVRNSMGDWNKIRSAAHNKQIGEIDWTGACYCPVPFWSVDTPICSLHFTSRAARVRSDNIPPTAPKPQSNEEGTKKTIIGGVPVILNAFKFSLIAI